jgi:cytochrome b561
MQIKNNAEKYGIVSIVIHWVVAVLIIGQISVGLYMADLPVSLQKIKLFGWHKEFGLLILFIAVIRISWRLSHISPLLPRHMPVWQHYAAKFTHFFLYVALFALPISGWLHSSASGIVYYA